MRRLRRAPRAIRTAISLCRSAARASSRFATFAQAISRTNATAPRRSMSAGRRSPTNDLEQRLERSCSARAFEFGYCSARRLAMPTTSARACSTLTPGFRRPMT